MIDGKPVTALRGVGERQAQRLRALGVETTQDLLFLLPLRYEDRTRVVALGEVAAGRRAVVERSVASVAEETSGLRMRRGVAVAGLTVHSEISLPECFSQRSTSVEIQLAVDLAGAPARTAASK